MSINPGYLYTKFNATSIWQFVASNHRKYGLVPLVQDSNASNLYIIVDYALTPLFEKLEDEDRPRIVLMTHTEQSKKDNLLTEPEKKLYLDQVMIILPYFYSLLIFLS